METFVWEKELLAIINDYKNGSNEALDGDEVERLTNIIKGKINFQEGNITLDEYLKGETG